MKAWVVSLSIVALRKPEDKESLRESLDPTSARLHGRSGKLPRELEEIKAATHYMGHAMGIRQESEEKNYNVRKLTDDEQDYTTDNEK